MGMARPEPKGAAQWVDAAYAQFASAGLSSVRVEALARDLGTTKGSFYWHFSGRPQLIEAVMQRWEELETAQAIEIAEAEGNPEERLRALFQAVAARSSMRQGEVTLYVDADSEGVGAAVARVSQRRIDYITTILIDMGFDRAEAARRATVTLATVLGLLQLRAATGERLVVLDDTALIRTAFAMATAPAQHPRRP